MTEPTPLPVDPYGFVDMSAMPDEDLAPDDLAHVRQILFSSSGDDDISAARWDELVSHATDPDTDEVDDSLVPVLADDDLDDDDGDSDDDDADDDDDELEEADDDSDDDSDDDGYFGVDDPDHDDTDDDADDDDLSDAGDGGW